ncbi:glycosyltransferase family 2 protein [Bradyrhizobium sp. BRP20]|uniref:glycosyltransferase family 2 protein n=1 Tax=unclassified Bradyrhizobium TaxID=2631580 RepID=UPI001CD392AD|nr:MULTISPECIES: glycosyltransferase family 2 protein [unclassified Bradyrhizobium]MCA1392263.1 glycosyltransferase family 2 protein [Bradyrhizobium sp. IC3123]MCA1433532.1 glycosyltransferase family 2 protein [Bradyrhizobium sp. BRP20]
MSTPGTLEQAATNFVSIQLKPQCVVVFLTYNSASIIRETVEQAKKIGADLFAVDSFSTDDTTAILDECGCTVSQRAFSNYSDQRNWAIAQVSAYSWQLHLDADEVLDDQAVQEIRAILSGKPKFDAYMLRRRDYFMGKMLRFSGVNPWHLRLFRSGAGQCEARLYDQHFVSNQPCGKLAGLMHDKNSASLGDWIVRHNRWSDAEVSELSKTTQQDGPILRGRLTGDARERTRFVKGVYYSLPSGLRSLVYFFYRYLLRLGFLDGKVGFYFAFFQALWFRMLVDAKMYERHLERGGDQNNV